MRARTIERILWTTAALAAAWAIVGWRSATPDLEETVSSIPAHVAAPRVPDVTAPRTASELIVGSDPFRLDRRPSPIAYQRELTGAPQIAAPMISFRPPLTVSGFIGGPPWEALVEGVPGKEGSTLVRAGDKLGDLRVRAVKRDTVIIQGPDTTWKLTLRRAWQ